jgi:hypothetical protein
MTPLATPAIPVSWGELLDKLTILAIKRRRLTRADALANVAREHDLLAAAAAPALAQRGMPALFAELEAVNADLWDIEDAIREEEAAARFEAEFIRLARAVYRRNDDRAAIKRRINDALGSALVEEKSYADWNAPR